MPARIIQVESLQPTHTLRANNFGVLKDLPVEDLDKIDEDEGLPQVWETNLGLLISDGNQRIGARARKGQKLINVDYGGEVPAYMLDFLEIITTRARELQERGIHTVYDLAQV